MTGRGEGGDGAAGYDPGMSARPTPPRVSTVGYAMGTGAAVMALAAPVLHFAYPDVSDWIHFIGTFVTGGILGAVLAALRAPRLGE